MIHPDAAAYIDAIDAVNRALFERVDVLVRSIHPEVVVTFAYKMPTFVVGERRLHVAAWKHGISFYGWDAEHDGGLVARFPKASSGRGTLRLTPADATEVTDAELIGLLRGALDPRP